MRYKKLPALKLDCYETFLGKEKKKKKERVIRNEK